MQSSMARLAREGGCLHEHEALRLTIALDRGIIGALFETPEQAAREAIENDVHLVGVRHVGCRPQVLVPQLIEELKRDRGAEAPGRGHPRRRGGRGGAQGSRLPAQGQRRRGLSARHQHPSPVEEIALHGDRLVVEGKKVIARTEGLGYRIRRPTPFVQSFI
jgi:hypothetical protein